VKNTWKLTVSIVGGIFIIAGVIGFKMISDNEKKKEIKNKAPRSIAPSNIIDKQLVAPELINSTTVKPVANFTFVDQLGDTIDQTIVDNKIYVADYFFTTCGGICPAMSDQMKRVHAKYKNRKDFAILSHTVWPEVDTVEAMLAYSKKYGATPKQWYFLTGEKKALYDLARKSYFILKPAAVKGEGDGESDFIHTALFVLVDKNKKIRGYFDGTDPEEVDEMMTTIDYLLLQ